MTTIRDVARASGVSIATVSRVINGSTRVSDDTRRRVWDAASRLEYWPNGAARTLTTSRTSSLGVLLPDLYGEFFSEVIRGIDRAARIEKLQILISSSHADTEGVLAAARSLRGRVDGLIVMAPDKGSSGAIDQIRRRFPMVLLNPRRPIRGSHSLSIANFDGAYAVARHVLTQGHRSVAIIKGPHGNVDAEERLRGYRRALREAGLKEGQITEFPGDFTEPSGGAAAEGILRLHPRPTAVFASNDYMAIGLLSALRESGGLRVPEDLVVTGFDDIAIAQYLMPPLTTVRVDACGLGERAVGLLISSLRTTARIVGRRETIPVTLVVRRSTGNGGPAEIPVVGPDDGSDNGTHA